MSNRILIGLAGFCGATGVALSAVAAHSVGQANLSTAAHMLLFHAPAFLALALLVESRLRLMAAIVIAAGLLLFDLDLIVRALAGWDRLFPLAAPSGGILMIGGWLLIAASAFQVCKN